MRLRSAGGGLSAHKTMIRLKYGNTNTYFVNGLLIDTDYAGTLGAFYKALKANGHDAGEIRWILATHYHPDHMGLIGELTARGAGLLLIDTQRDSVHFSDRIFEREKRTFVPVNEGAAKIISCAESRDFLAGIGIQGEIVSTPSHSEDSVSLILDNGDCFVGDLEPIEYLDACGESEALRRDWETLLSHGAKRIHSAHRPDAVTSTCIQSEKERTIWNTFA